MLIERWTGARIFKAMNAEVIVLPKLDLKYEVKILSNNNWWKKVWIFLGLNVREKNQIGQDLPPRLSRIL